MARKRTPETIAADRALIERHGATKLAELLNEGLQTVCNWKVRGIPEYVKLARPDLFLPHLAERQKKTARA